MINLVTPIVLGIMNNYNNKQNLLNMKKCHFIAQLSNFLLLIFLFTLIFSSCEKQQIEIPEPTTNQPDEMIKLGKKLENPFTVVNVKKAYNNLVSQGIVKSGLEITATHQYVRLLPSDMEQYDMLEADTLNVMFDYPLDYEIFEGGTYYFDPELDPQENPFTWQYVVIPIDKPIPPVKAEKIAEIVLDISAMKNTDAYTADLWDMIETEALRITGNLLTEESTTKSRWRPSGTNTAWDDMLNRQIPLQGAKVRARWWFFWNIGITNADGYFEVDGTFKGGRKVNYTIIWERADWDIVGFNFEFFGWWQAYYNGPEQNTAWNLAIGSATDTDRSLRYATIHRALIHYFFSDRLGLKKPYDPAWYQWKLKVGYSHNAGTSNAIPYLTIYGRPHAEVYGRSSGSSTWRKTYDIFATTIHEVAHASHYDLIGRYSFSEAWNNRDTRIVVESWAEAVEWGLTNQAYNALGHQYNNSTARNYNHSAGLQWWNRSLVNSSDPTDNDRFYTPLYIDMVDNINQRQTYGGNTNYPNDNVTGYTFSLLEDKVLRHTYGLTSLRTKMKANKPSGVTDAQIDALIDSYSNL